MKEIPGVLAALKWLLPVVPKATDRSIVVRARLCGLVLSETKPHWHANGRQINRLAAAALRRLPDDAGALAEILYGLGEIGARSDAKSLAPLLKRLSRRRERINFFKVIEAAFALDAKTRHSIDLNAVARAQWITKAKLEWQTFDQALRRIERGDGTTGEGRYGARFVARIILTLDPRVIDRWIATHPNRQSLAVIGSAAMSMVFPFDEKAELAPLLRSKTPAICCIGAAAVVCPIELLGKPPDFREGMRLLTNGGVDPADAIWMIGMRINLATRERNGREYQAKQDSARLRYIERVPAAAVGGIGNAEVEQQNLRTSLEENARRYAELLPELEILLSELAQDWPANGLSDQQMNSVESIFFGKAEMRHRLAAKLHHSSNREWLLKKNIERLRQFIGLERKPEDVPRNHFRADEDQFQPLAQWAAQSVVLLYAADNRGIGRRTSDLVAGVALAAEGLLQQPFAAGRKPEEWQSIIGRAATADRFVLTVMASVPDGQQQCVSGLRRLALDHVFKMLTAENPPFDALELFHKMTADAVEQMAFLDSPDEERRKWAVAEELPDFARAMALWSSPALVTQHKALATALFLSIGTVPLSSSQLNLQMSRLLTLLDLAIASSAKTGSADLIASIVDLWPKAYEGWRSSNDKWLGAAELLAQAVAADGPARVTLLADPDFSNSHCRRLIDRPAN